MADSGLDDRSSWPDGWSRPAATAGFGCLTVVFGLSGVVSGLAITVAATLDGHALHGLQLGLIMAGFGATFLCYGAVSSLRVGAGSPPRLTTVQYEDALRTGVLVPYSRIRLALALAGSCGAVVGGAALLVSAPLGLGWPGYVLGPAVLLAGVAGAVAIGRVRGGDSGLLFLPDGLLKIQGARRTFVPWSHIQRVITCHRSVAGPPELELRFAPQATIEAPTAALGILRRRRRVRGIDLTSTIWTLAVGPVVVYLALTYYHEHPDKRAELGDRRGVQRIAQRDLT